MAPMKVWNGCGAVVDVGVGSGDHEGVGYSWWELEGESIGEEAEDERLEIEVEEWEVESVGSGFKDGQVVSSYSASKDESSAGEEVSSCGCSSIG